MVGYRLGKESLQFSTPDDSAVELLHTPERIATTKPTALLSRSSDNFSSDDSQFDALSQLRVRSPSWILLTKISATNVLHASEGINETSDRIGPIKSLRVRRGHSPPTRLISVFTRSHCNERSYPEGNFGRKATRGFDEHFIPLRNSDEGFARH